MADETDGALISIPKAPPKVVKVLSFIDPDKLKMDISYSLTDLSSAMMEQSALFVHYGMLAAQAAKQVDDVKMLLEIAESKVDRLIRDKAAKEGAKLTEPQLERALKTHDQLIAFRRALNEAKQIEAMCKTAARGFEQRRDMLIQHGAQSRKELDGELRTMGRPDAASEGAARVRALRTA